MSAWEASDCKTLGSVSPVLASTLGTGEACYLEGVGFAMIQQSAISGFIKAIQRCLLGN
jgi:hypothetical protein